MIRTEPHEAWRDWRWQLRHARRPADDWPALAPEGAGAEALAQVLARYPAALPPYLERLIQTAPAGERLARQFIPSDQEACARGPKDALAEERHMPVPGLIRRYPDRAVVLATNACPAYCRFCTRKRRVGHHAATWWTGRRAIVDYLRAHDEIRDVLISGGDPLILPTRAISRILDELEALPSLDVIRVASRAPVILPMRLDDPALIARLARSRRLWFNTQVNHPDELTPDAVGALGRLVEAGIPVGCQTVLLAGVNDDVETLSALLRGLVRHRVRPYYLFLCEPGRGIEHFRTTVDHALALVAALRGRVSGLAIPTLAVDLPDGHGKVALTPDVIEARRDGEIVFRAWDGARVRYPDAAP